MRIALPFHEVSLRVVGPKDSYFVSRVQRLDVPTTIPTTVIDELGNIEHAGTLKDIPDVTATISLMDTSVLLFAYLTGTDPTSYPASGVDVVNLADVDLIGYVKDEDVMDYVKSLHVKQARTTGFTFSYDINAESTEEYTFGATNKRWFKNDVVVDQYDGPDAGPLTLSETPITLKNGDELLTFVVDGLYWEEVTSGETGEQYSVSGTSVTLGQSLAAGESAQAVYHANPAGTNWSYIDDTVNPPAIRGKDVPILIGANSIYRVQSVVVRGTFPAEQVKELGNDEIVGYITQVPRVTGDVTVLDTDTELMRLLATGEADPADTEYSVTEFVDTLSLEIRLLDPDDTTNATILKTIYIPRITITSDGHTANVGGNATQTYSFESYTGECIVYSGAR